MKTSLVQIGNSRGVRIPKTFLEQAGLRDEIEIEVRGSQVVIRPANHPRAGWDEAFAAMALRGDDRLLDPVGPSMWDESEWVW
jgi:antitoxin MazE